LKPRDIERRKMTCELLLQRHRKKSFLYRIVTSDEKWIYYDNLKCKKSWCRRTLNIDGKAEYSWLMLCIWWDQLGVVYYELLQPNETSLRNTTNYNWCIELSIEAKMTRIREKTQQNNFLATLDHMLRNQSRKR